MKLGIIGAMEEEVEGLRTTLAGAVVHEAAGLVFHEGTLRGLPAVVVRCGIGKVNAACCATAVTQAFGATHVVNTGVAGALDVRLDVGDLVVSTDCVEHDFDLRPLGYEPGQIPGMPLAFAADEGLRTLAVRAALESSLEATVIEGRIASGDVFVADDALKGFLTAHYGAVCAEMEGAAIAHACTLSGVPFVVVRAMSDKADGSAQVSYDEFEHGAAQVSIAVVERLAELLAQG